MNNQRSSALQQRDVFRSLIDQAESDFRTAAARTGLDWQAEALYALQACENNPFLGDIAKKNPLTIRMSVVNVALIGLSLNPAMQLAFLVPRDGRIILDISYRGLIKLATDTGSILWAKAELVYEKDQFEYRGPAQTPHHVCDPFSTERGEFRGAYCIAKTVDGEILVEVMSAADIFKARDQSPAYAKKKSGPWVEWFAEMCKKVVIKRASKTWPRTDRRLHEAIRYLNEEAGEGFVEPRASAPVADPEQPEVIPSDDAIDQAVKAQVEKIIQRAAKAGAWSAAREYMGEKFSGSDLSWARFKLMEAEKAAA